MCVRIVGVGSYHPERSVPNSELGVRVRLDAAGIYRRTGIRRRYWAADGESTSDLAAAAGRRALDHAQIAATAVDLIIVSTTSPDMQFPSTACLVQRHLGARRAAAFDVAASCAGFLFALDVGRRYVATGAAPVVLVIAAEVKSRFINPHDAGTAILFGDGAAAAVLRRAGGESEGILSLVLHSDGTGADWIDLPAGGSRRPTTTATLAAGLNSMRMQGGRVFRASVRRLVEVTHEALAAAGLRLSEIDHFVYHQANGRILAQLARRLGLAPPRLPITLEDCGNTSSASVPMALARLVEQGRVKPGERLLLGAFGGGLNWGAAAIQW